MGLARRNGRGAGAPSPAGRIAFVALLAAGAGAAATCGGGENDPCGGVGCSARGFCVTDGDDPYCACISGFHPVFLECVANDAGDPCRGVECSAHGTCRAAADGPTCDCLPGYRHLAGGGDVCADTECDLVCVAIETADGGTEDGSGPPVEDCANGVDDDGDGTADCADSECDGRTCASGVCFELACCTPAADPCGFCRCDSADDGCGGSVLCGDCESGYSCVECRCYALPP